MKQMDKLITDERMAHMHGVAEYCFCHAADPFYDLDPHRMYVLGLLHDIGYVDGAKHHEQFGGNLLKALGYADWKMVYDHAKLLTMDDMHNKCIILLIEADLKVDMSGNISGYDAKLSDIAAKHGTDSRAYALCKKNIEFLESIGR